MHDIWLATWEYVADAWKAFLRGWNQFWFAPRDPTTLAAIRICTGAILLYVHVTCVFRMPDFLGEHAWVDAQAINALRTVATDRTKVPLAEQPYHEWWGQSVYFYVQDPTALYAIYLAFIVAIACFTFGLFTRWANLLVWLGHLSYLHRGYIIWFGMDTVLCMLLLYLLIAPSGATLSVDRLIARWRAARNALKSRSRLPAEDEVPPSWQATLATRLIQLHMGIIYFCAGCAKLQGSQWWSGYAGWYTMQYKEFEVVPMGWLGHAPDWVWQSLSAAVTLFTIVFEIGFIFVVWNRRVRPFVLLAAVMLHAGIGLFMGLGGFAMAMLTGCSAFVYPESMRWFVSVLLKGPAGYRLQFDRQDPAQLRMATWVRVADPYEQIELIDAGGGQPGGRLIGPDGASSQGLGAFFRLARSFKVFWLTWPFAVWSFLGKTSDVPVNRTLERSRV